jgi:UDP-GlcNAc:undecaprenyl-phosphate GlcNAc-1-phosphate transferase
MLNTWQQCWKISPGKATTELGPLSFPFNVYLLALFGAGLTSALTLPLWRALCICIGLVDEPSERKIHDKPTALSGGLAILTGLCAPVIFGALAVHRPFDAGSPLLLDMSAAGVLTYGLGKRTVQLGAILVGGVGMVGFGLVDDKIELRPITKFMGQLLIAALVAAAGVRITLFVHSKTFSYAITVLWILTVTNAVNFMDNMNGLCAGIGAIGAWFFGLCAATAGQYLVALMALLACGALLGFLPYNFPKASAFLGDSGSHLVGYLLAILGILLHFHTPQHHKALAVLTPLAILIVPLADMVWVVLFRSRLGKPFYVGDTNHISHQLVRRGLSQTSAVLLLWLAMAATGALAFL